MVDQPWIKFYPSDFLTGVTDLTPDEIGAYIVLLSMMWDRGGPIPDDRARIARRIGCSTRRWNQLRTRLLDEGKIEIRGGSISNRRAINDLRSRDNVGEKRSNSARLRWDKNAENSVNPPQNLDSVDASAFPTHAHARSRSQKPDTRADADASATHVRAAANSESLKSSKANAESIAEFEAWYGAYPHKVGKAAARTAYVNARSRGATAGDLTTGLFRYKADKPPDRQWCNPATWLNQDRHQDQPAPAPPVSFNSQNQMRQGHGNAANRAGASESGYFAEVAAQRRRDFARIRDGDED